MLKLARGKNTISVETLGGIVTWDDRRGGQIAEFTLKNDLAAHSILGGAAVLPDLQMTVNGKRVRLAGVSARMEVTKKTASYATLRMTSTLVKGLLDVVQEYEIHEEGALFCNLAIETPAGKSFDLGAASLNLAIDTAPARNVRWGDYRRQPRYKRDYSTVHAFTAYDMFRTLKEKVDERELLPFFSLDLGWEDTRFFSNHLEFFLEDWSSFDDGPLAQTRTKAGKEDGIWQAHWSFHDGRTVRINGSYRYRNRWGVMFGRARTRAGADADPAVRNNCLGARICHCMYPYVRVSDTWPWVSMPIKQVAVQTPQLFKGNPELARVDEASRLGANMMLVHQFWMKNPGSNNEPIADYRVNDAKWLRAYTDRCHKRGMRVGYYCRGTEMWQQFSPFFEDHLTRDWDGLYADWNTPFCMGYTKCSPLHVSVHNYFHFTKAMRQRVGPGGILIGHTGNANLIASACFDVAVGGEFSVQHDQLLSHPESSAYYGQLNCMGANLISGNLPDRIAFSSPKAAAICAALGMMSHPFMEPGVAFSDRVAYIKPLWDSLNSLPGAITRLHNPAFAPTRAVSTGAAHLFPSLWQADSGKALLLVTNMAATAQSDAVELRLKELGVPARSKIRALPIPGTFSDVGIDGNVVRLDNIPSLKFAAVLIG